MKRWIGSVPPEIFTTDVNQIQRPAEIAVPLKFEVMLLLVSPWELTATAGAAGVGD
jgi:hypothetical protein